MRNLDNPEFVDAMKSKFPESEYLSENMDGMFSWLSDTCNLGKHPKNYLLFAYNWVKKADKFRENQRYRRSMQNNVSEHHRLRNMEDRFGKKSEFRLKSFGEKKPSYLNEIFY